MDIIIIAIINVIITLALLGIEYTDFVHRRLRFFERVSRLAYAKVKNKLEKWLVFVPDWLYYWIKPQLERTRKKKREQRSVPLLQQITPGKLALINLCALVLSWNLEKVTSISIGVWVVVFVIAQVVAYFLLKNRQVHARQSFEKRLPEILDIMARVYRVHSDLRYALMEVAKHNSDPIVKSYVTDMVQLSRFGYTVEEAMEYVAKRVNSPDLDFVIASIKINIPVGGDLAHLFEHTARLLRQRKEARDEISNLMFQSKFSSIASALLIPLIIIFSFSTNENYKEILIHDPTGRLIFIGCLFWWLIGVVIIRKNSRIAL
ncbi:MAG: type II secretion system F family protein [Patescibacteria group bacterium]